MGVAQDVGARQPPPPPLKWPVVYSTVSMLHYHNNNYGDRKYWIMGVLLKR